MAITGSIAAVAALGSSVYQGEQQRKEQKEALRSQERGMLEASNRAQQQQRMSEEAMNKANRKKPDVNQILKDQGIVGASTMLTGPMGVSTGGNIQKNSLLGG
jgi:uncharacterized protein HemX